VNIDKHILKNNEGSKVSLFYRMKAAVCVLMGWHTQIALHDGVLVAHAGFIGRRTIEGKFVAGIRVARGLRDWAYESYWVRSL
jgi:hypothetical protein